MSTSTVENYLKQLYLEQQSVEGEVILMGRMAAAMNVAPGTATAMMKGLAESGLVDYRPRSGVRLTRKGEQLALGVLRRHRLVETFLVEVLGLDWSEVHEEAEALEHAISERVLERIDVALGNPTHDPHGDPIPTAQGRVRKAAQCTLADAAEGAPLTVVRVADQSPAFLKFIERQGMMPGTQVVVVSRDAAAEAIRVRASGKRIASLGIAAAAKVFVEGR